VTTCLENLEILEMSENLTAGKCHCQGKLFIVNILGYTCLVAVVHSRGYHHTMCIPHDVTVVDSGGRQRRTVE